MKNNDIVLSSCVFLEHRITVKFYMLASILCPCWIQIISSRSGFVFRFVLFLVYSSRFSIQTIISSTNMNRQILVGTPYQTEDVLHSCFSEGFLKIMSGCWISSDVFCASLIPSWIILIDFQISSYSATLTVNFKLTIPVLVKCVFSLTQSSLQDNHIPP